MPPKFHANRMNAQRILRAFDFVKWDRFVEGKDSIAFYGWIDRPQDSYKDVMVLELYKDDRRPWWITSSPLPEHDKKICQILDEDIKKTVACQRVEDRYNIKNKIKLKKV